MKAKLRSRRTCIVLALAVTFLPLNASHAQWEEWLGGWMIYAFGMCGAAGCSSGPNLCAVVQGGGDPSYCYER